MKKLIIIISCILILLVGCQLESKDFVKFSNTFEYLIENNDFKNKELQNSWQSHDVSYVEISDKTKPNNRNIVTSAKYDAVEIYDWFGIYSKDEVVKIKNEIIDLDCETTPNTIKCENKENNVIKYVFMEKSYIFRILCVGNDFNSSDETCEKIYSEIKSK